ncbi:MAG: hypothetical protein SFV51_06065 [Bryobacteraceae bacterium]|nr:hypothetical protein [Bryobacteraceae bacterium]
MPVFNPRNRLVNFRLSDEEFDQLRASSAVSGARSLSDFARNAVMRCAAETASGRVNPPRPDIDSKVIELECRVTELVALIEALKQDGVNAAAVSGEAAAAHHSAGDK